jgi:phosphoglycerol transferase MdoB-like AlkP superfamily enzyme
MGRISRTSIFILVGCLLVSLACVVYPMYVIRPFRAQGPTELAAALTIIRIRPVLTVLAVLLSVGGLLYNWRWRTVLTVLGAAFVCVLAALARVNVYELMFHPIGHPSFAAASEVKLDKDEKVIAVKIGSSARAYPVRGMSYHHVVNDVVDNVAIVATY